MSYISKLGFSSASIMKVFNRVCHMQDYRCLLMKLQGHRDDLGKIF